MTVPDAVGVVEQVLAARTDLDQYGSNKRLLFAAELILQIDDIHAVAGTSLTDGSGDRSCDFVHIDRPRGLVVLAQAYNTDSPTRRSVPVGKVGDLYEAVQTVLGGTASGLPVSLGSAITDVHASINEGAVRKIEIWFVNNLDDQPQLRTQMREKLDGLADAARSALTTKFPDVAADIDVEAVELSRPALAEWFRSYQTPILVTDTIAVPATDFMIERGPGWTAYLTSVPMEWLKQQFWAYGDRLFSGNVRGYLGKINAPGNINNGIRTTLREEPDNFWIYNNGVTALVNAVEVREYGVGVEHRNSAEDLVITGLSIVNGAQTTGALHQSAELGSIDPARVMIRFIECADPTVIGKIIRYNNRQNLTLPADFRSNDPVQRRLVGEFAEIGVSGYSGGRRGGAEDSIRRTAADEVSATEAARAVVAFHGDPGTAYFEPGAVWARGDLYHHYFNEATTARHLLLCWGLARAIDERRQELRQQSDLSPSKQAQLEYLNRRGSTMLLIAAVAGCLDAVIDRCPTDRFRLRCGEKAGLADAVDLWRRVVAAVGPGLDRLSPVLVDARKLRRREEVDAVVKAFREVVSPWLSDNDDIRAVLAERVEVKR
ncbi:MAG TPA: AIPR family protein [Micromonosporaceae bacterium]|nr:AIPR family protein [Micromonosporaceae bacterium]